jgi:hypothetical protein
MHNHERAAAFVILVMYAPLVPLLWVQKAGRPLTSYIPVLPGWWFTIPAHGNEQVQYWIAGIATCCILIGLCWIARKGPTQLYIAVFVAFLNSAIIASVTWFFTGLAGSGALAAP